MQMSEVVNAPGVSRTMMPDAVALMGTVEYAPGQYFNPESCSKTYGRDASGNITTETASDGENVWVKTYTWTDGVFTAESKWVKQ